MGDTILLRRGTLANLPALQAGEPGWAEDANQLFIGTSTGSAASAMPVGDYDYCPESFTQASIETTLALIGTSNKVTLLIRPGTWPIISNVDWSAYTNVTFKIVPGAVLSHGAFTVNIPNINAGLYTIFSGAGAVTISGKTTKVYPHWFGADPLGVTDSTTAFTYAMTAAPSGQIYLAGGTFTVAGLTAASTTWHGEWATIQGDGDLLLAVNSASFDKIVFKNITTAGKLVTLAAGSMGGVNFTDCNLQKATHHIYKASGTLVNSKLKNCVFGGGSLATGASTASRTYNSLNLYVEEGCYTWFNGAGLFMTWGSSVLLIDGVSEYNTQYDITVDVTAGQAMQAMKIQNYHFEADAAKAYAYVHLACPATAGMNITFDNVYATNIAATNKILADSTGGTAYVKFTRSSTIHDITSGLGALWMNYHDDFDTDSGTYGSMAVTGMTLAGGATTVTASNKKYIRRGDLIMFSFTLTVNAGTMASVGGATYIVHTGPAVTYTNGSVTAVSPNTGLATNDGYVSPTALRIYLPTWAADAGPVYISGTYLVN